MANQPITAVDQLRYHVLQIEELSNLVQGCLGQISPTPVQARQFVDRIINRCLDIRAVLADQQGLYRLQVKTWSEETRTLTEVLYHAATGAEAKEQARQYSEFFVEELRLHPAWKNTCFQYIVGQVTPTLNLQPGVIPEPSVQMILHSGPVDAYSSRRMPEENWSGWTQDA